MEVGIIGIGQMGAGMAKSLLRAGHQVTVFNRTPARAKALEASGAKVAASVAEACRAGTVLTIPADDAALESLVFERGGILESLPKGGIHISSATISVALSDRLAEEHSRTGQIYVAAPVFGRPEAAENAKLAVVAAGPASAIEKCKPLFESLGPKLLVLGEKASQANVVKLAGNFLISSVIESLSESFALARKAGVDAPRLLEFLTSTLFNAPVYKTYGGLIVNGDPQQVGFTTKLAFKDNRLVLQAAEAAAVPMPIASVVHDRFVTAIARGNASKDWSVLGRLAAEDAGLPVS
ncbi:MAG TPA: NAD(P)-dependent oxidoreductase [Candidatus Acidoferrales bacterium]|nr:NAD(P)-dependent oxidoreductase [Candidatus Acidoferrales bacterium]